MRCFWTERELDVMHEKFADTPTQDLARELGRTYRAVCGMAEKLGLKKSPEYLAGPHAARIVNGEKGKANRFKKGQQPWNAGLKGVYQPGGRAAETQFKPGQAPSTARPVGSERITKDGWLERKVAEPKVWVGVHRLVREEHNGPVPEGYVVTFRSDDRTDVRIENLELASKAEIMARNSYHNRYPKEIAEVIQLRGVLTRQINRRERA